MAAMVRTGREEHVEESFVQSPAVPRTGTRAFDQTHAGTPRAESARGSLAVPLSNVDPLMMDGRTRLERDLSVTGVRPSWIRWDGAGGWSCTTWRFLGVGRISTAMIPRPRRGAGHRHQALPGTAPSRPRRDGLARPPPARPRSRLSRSYTSAWSSLVRCAGPYGSPKHGWISA
jgi:hypothetical protein